MRYLNLVPTSSPKETFVNDRSMLHLASDFLDTEAQDQEAKTRPLSKTPPPKFVVMREGKIEPLHASSRAEAEAKVTNQVRVGQVPVVYIFELALGILYEPSSVTLSPEQINERLNPTKGDQ
jgi:hypothetical protein